MNSPAIPGATGVLVIKLGALGDWVQALAAFAAIRRHHVGQPLTLLTTEPYVDLAHAAGYFDAVWVDTRPGAVAVGGWLALRQRLRNGGFQRVYDLQTSDRSAFYFRLFWPGPYPEWSGIARGCSHPHANPRRDSLHTVDRLAEQLRAAGVTEIPDADLSWAGAGVGDDLRKRLDLDAPYALLVPGGAAHRPAKRWPAERYVDIAQRMAAAGVTPVLIGAAAEEGLLNDICGALEGISRSPRNLAGRTGLADIAGLARGAVMALGNDTGPMHLIALAGCPCAVLYSDASDPALCGQRGPAVRILRQPRLLDLSADEVAVALASVAPGHLNPRGIS